MVYIVLNKILCRVDLEINFMQSGFGNKLFINSYGFFVVIFIRIVVVYRRLINLKVLYGWNVYFCGVLLIVLVVDFLESQCFIGVVILEIDSQGVDCGFVYVVRELQIFFMYCNKLIGCMYIYMYMLVECKLNEYMYMYNYFFFKNFIL